MTERSAPVIAQFCSFTWSAREDMEFHYPVLIHGDGRNYGYLVTQYRDDGGNVTGARWTPMEGLRV